MEEGSFLCLDVGSSKLVLMVVDAGDHSSIRDAGIYTSESAGIQNGTIVDRELFQNALRNLVIRSGLGGEANRLPVVVSFSGPAVSFYSMCADVKLRGSGPIVQKDIESLIDKVSKAFSNNSSATVVHIEPTKYRVDDVVGIRSPISMYGEVLEGTFGVLCASNSAIANLVSAVSASGLHTKTVVPAVAASGYFCSKLIAADIDEKTCVLDIGGQTTNVSIMRGDKIVWTGYIPLGGDSITSDLAVAVGIDINEASSLKHGLTDAICSQTLPESNIRNPIYVGDVVRCRMEEIVGLVLSQDPEHSGGLKQPISHKIILCGGGAMLRRAPEMISIGCGIPCITVQAYAGNYSNEFMGLAVRDPSLSSIVGSALIVSEKMMRSSSKSKAWL